MTRWNELLQLLDEIFGFTDRNGSKVKKVRQGFDNKTQEHVIWLEYRTRVSTAGVTGQRPKAESGELAFMRELLGDASKPTRRI